MAVNYPSSPERSEQEHLAALNGPIEAISTIAHPFEPSDLHMRDGEKDISPLVETTKAIDVGSHVLAVLKADFGAKPDGSRNIGAFTPLFAKEEPWKENGAIQIVEAGVTDDIPLELKDEASLRGDNKKQKQLNKDLESLGTGDKNYRSLNVPGMVDYQIHDVNPGRFVVVTVTTADGKRVPVALNMKDRGTGMEGHIFVARYPNSGDFAFLQQPKPVVGEKKIGPPQGFAGPLDPRDASYAGLRDELGIDAMTRSIKLQILEEDLTTSLVDDRFFLMSLNMNDEAILARPDLMQNMETQLDKLAKLRMSRSDAFDAVVDNRINGAHAVTGIALSMLDRGEVILNPRIDTNKDGLVLTHSAPDFDPTKARISLIRGATDLGRDQGGIFADPTKSRDKNPVMLVDKKDVKPGKHFFATWADVFDVMKGGQGVKNNLGVVETAALFSYGVKRGIIIPNFR